jgi:hypothetical protein
MSFAEFKKYCKKCKNEAERKKQYEIIKSFCKTNLKTNGETKRIYAYSENTPVSKGGRLYSGSSVQALPKAFRGFLMKHTTDIDMKNAHPKILQYICHKNNTPCPILDYYINNRDAVLATFQDRSEDDAKELFLQSINDCCVKRGIPHSFFNKFDKETKELQKIVTEIPEYEEIVNSVPASTKYNRIGSAINRIFCMYENRILQECVSVLNSKGIEVCTLMFDGCMLYGDHYQNTQLLTDITDTINQKFEGLNMVWAYKPHDDSIKIPDDFEYKPVKKTTKSVEPDTAVAEAEPTGVKNDMEAAQKVFELHPHWVCCENELFVFNLDTGMWDNSTTAHRESIVKYSKHLYLLHETKDGFRASKTKSYGNTLTLMDKIPPLIRTFCVDNNWIKTSQYTSLGKILFLNGYYDFQESLFYSKEKYGFDPKIVFMGKIHNNFENFTTEDMEYMEDVKQRLFYNSLGKEVGDYTILQLARGLAGDMMKRILFGLGPSNTGKGVLTTALMLACGDYIGSFNAENLAYRQSSNDEAQIMRWAMLLRYKRIVISNEIKSTVELNGNMIKKIASGGDPLIGRNHGGKETEFIAQFLPFVLANDLPNFKPYDDAVDNRVRVIGYNKSYVDEPSNLFELKKDDNIKNELKELRFQRVFVGLLIRAYLEYKTNGEPDDPAEVLQAKENWVAQDNSVIDTFMKDYEITNNPTDFIYSSQIEDWIESNKMGISMKKFGMELKKYCAIRDFKEVVSKDKKDSGRSLKAWVGVRHKSTESSNTFDTEDLIDSSFFPENCFSND